VDAAHSQTCWRTPPVKSSIPGPAVHTACRSVPLKDTQLRCVIHTASVTLQCMQKGPGTCVVVNPVCCHGKVADYRARAHPDAQLFAGREHSDFLGGTEASEHVILRGARQGSVQCPSAGLTHLNGLASNHPSIQVLQSRGGQPCTFSWHSAPNEAPTQLAGVPHRLQKVVILQQHSA
jgi:hypothetical protein